MPKFDEFMNAFQYNAEVYNPDEFKAAALAAWQEDIQGVTTVAESKDKEIAERDAKIKELGLANWELLMKQGPPVPNGASTSAIAGQTEAVEPRTIDSFFGSKKKEE